MARRPLTFQQGEVTRLAKAVIAAGLPIGRVDVIIQPDGTRRVTAVVREATDDASPAQPNEWDDAR